MRPRRGIEDSGAPARCAAPTCSSSPSIRSARIASARTETPTASPRTSIGLPAAACAMRTRFRRPRSRCRARVDPHRLTAASSQVSTTTRGFGLASACRRCPACSKGAVATGRAPSSAPSSSTRVSGSVAGSTSTTIGSHVATARRFISPSGAQAEVVAAAGDWILSGGLGARGSGLAGPQPAATSPQSPAPSAQPPTPSPWFAWVHLFDPHGAV